MSKLTKQITIHKSKHGLPCMWESGGGATNTGSAVIICSATGRKKKPLHIPKGGQLSNGQHALIPVFPNDHMIEAEHSKGDFRIKVWKIKNLLFDKAELILMNSYDKGEWDKAPGVLFSAITAAQQKAETYHCRKATYVLSGEEPAEEPEVKAAIKANSDMSMVSALMVLAGGNPGSFQFLMEVHQNAGMFQFLIMCKILECGIEGDDLYVLWNDLCNRNMDRVRILCKVVPDEVLREACSRQDYTGNDLIAPYLVKALEDAGYEH